VDTKRNDERVETVEDIVSAVVQQAAVVVVGVGVGVVSAIHGNAKDYGKETTKRAWGVGWSRLIGGEAKAAEEERRRLAFYLGAKLPSPRRHLLLLLLPLS
jgi:hypothetical protein